MDNKTRKTIDHGFRIKAPYFNLKSEPRFNDTGYNYNTHISYQFSDAEAGWTASATDFEDKKERTGIKIFIGLQGTAAAGLATSGILIGDFSQGFQHLWDTIDKGSTATGSFNLGRNYAWYDSHVRVPNNLGKIRKTPECLSSKVLNKSANIFDRFAPFSLNAPTFTGIGHILRNKARKLEIKADRLEKINNHFTESFIGRDIIHARINAVFAGIGSAVHIPQTVHGYNAMVQTGDLNGHIVGGGVAILGYGLMSADQIIESQRLNGEWFKKLRKSSVYSHEISHILAGYAARDEYAKDFLYKWLPSSLLFCKGGAYIWEASHIQGLPELFNNAATFSSNTSAPATALLVSGVIFGASAGYEFIEQNGKKASYLTKIAIRSVSDSIRLKKSKIINHLQREFITNNPSCSTLGKLPEGIVQSSRVLERKKEDPYTEIHHIALQRLHPTIQSYNNKAIKLRFGQAAPPIGENILSIRKVTSYEEQHGPIELDITEIDQENNSVEPA